MLIVGEHFLCHKSKILNLKMLKYHKIFQKNMEEESILLNVMMVNLLNLLFKIMNVIMVVEQSI